MAGSFGGSVKLSGESDYLKAIRNITNNLTVLSSEMKVVTSQYDKNDTSTENLSKQNDVLNKKLEEQNKKLSEAKKMLDEAKTSTDSNATTVQKWQTEVNKAQAEVNKTTNEIKKNEEAMKNADKATNDNADSIKDFANEEDKAGQSTLKLGDLIKANLISDAIKSGLSSLAGAMKKIGSTLIDVGKQALGSYADYEQLIGGVETLFKDSSGIVENYANNAYKTAGLGANEYMETVTSFSASLLQSLKGDTSKSAEVADMAITDMADNANKMGTSMESIQNAYQGFAKQNYTMLDNLKLGYGGTKSEMERLLADAEKVTGIKYDISNLNDVYQAIHIIQGELGITGTTAKEASTTIQGSVSSMKSAWTNLLTGLANGNADLGSLVNNLIDSVITVGNNILPVVEEVVNNVMEVLPEILQKVTENLPQFLESGKNIVISLVQGISNNLPDILASVNEIIGTLLDTIITLLPDIIQMGVTVLISLVQGIAQSLPELIPTIVDAVVTIVETLIDNIDLLIDAGIQLIMGLVEGLIEALPRLIDKIPEIIEKLIMAITDNLPKIIETGITLIIKLAEGLIKAIPQLISKIPEIINSLINGFANYFSNMSDIGKNMINGIWEGIKNAKDWLMGKVKEWCGSVLDGIKSFFGIHSPSTVFRDEVGKFMAEGIGLGFENEMSNVTREMQNAIPTKFDVNSTLIGNSTQQNNEFKFKEAMIEVFKQFKPSIILNDKEIGEFCFEYGDTKYGSYYN